MGLRPDAAAARACLQPCPQPLATQWHVVCSAAALRCTPSCPPVYTASASDVQVIGLMAGPTAPADILHWQKTLPGAPWSYLALVVLAYCTYEQASFVAARCAGLGTLHAGVQGQCCPCHLQPCMRRPRHVPWHGAGYCSRRRQTHRGTTVHGVALLHLSAGFLHDLSFTERDTSQGCLVSTASRQCHLQHRPILEQARSGSTGPGTRHGWNMQCPFLLPAVMAAAAAAL